MDVNLVVSKDMVRSIAPTFNGDGRLAAVAFQKIAAEVRKHEDDGIKMLTRDIVIEMGLQFGGSVDKACEAFERIYATINMVKRNQSDTKT
jgi:hypothetical protein